MEILLMLVLMVFDQKVDIGSPIPDEVWKIGEDPERGIYDAVVLMDVTEFHKIGINRYRKIRILSENGKAAAEFVDHSNMAGNFKGRVVDASGQETVFERKEDFVEVLIYRADNRGEKARVLVPPGLTSDCVVEFSWQIPTLEGLPPNSNLEIFDVDEPYFVLEKTFTIRPTATKDAGHYLSTRINTSKISPPASVERIEARGGITHIVYRNVPARLNYPFGNPYLNPQTAIVQVYRIYPNFGSDSDRYWKRFSSEILKEHIFDTGFRTRKYTEWLNQVKANLPENNVQAAVTAYNEFRKAFKSTDLMNPEQRAVMEKPKQGEDQFTIKHKLELVVERGYGEPYILAFLFYEILKDLKLDFRIFLTSNIYSKPFNPAELNDELLNPYYPSFGVPNGQSWVMFGPQHPEYGPGFIPTSRQGSMALMVDPKKWDYSIERVPRYGSKQHQRVRQYRLSLDSSGQLKMVCKETVSGDFEASLRRKYYVLGTEEAEEQLKTIWQNKLPAWRITTTKFEGAESLLQPIASHIQAVNTSMKALKESSLIAIDPFPGSTRPIPSPKIWPKNRVEPIILDKALNQIDLAQITVPEGWQVRGNPTWVKQNEVGIIKYMVQQKENLITVRRDMVINQDLLPPEKEPQLKALIAWMEEAWYQNLGLIQGVNQ